MTYRIIIEPKGEREIRSAVRWKQPGLHDLRDLGRKLNEPVAQGVMLRP